MKVTEEILIGMNNTGKFIGEISCVLEISQNIRYISQKNSIKKEKTTLISFYWK